MILFFLVYSHSFCVYFSCGSRADDDVLLFVLAETKASITPYTLMGTQVRRPIRQYDSYIHISAEVAGHRQVY